MSPILWNGGIRMYIILLILAFTKVYYELILLFVNYMYNTFLLWLPIVTKPRIINYLWYCDLILIVSENKFETN